MEATCQHIESGTDFGRTGDQVTNSYCGAPIPRLNGSNGEPCNARPWAETDPDAYCARGLMHYWHSECAPDCGKPHHAYLGPLASECASGHPVAVPSEAERGG